MRRSTAAALIAILLVAVIIRVLPLMRSLYWGSDVGEYYRISSGFVETGHVNTDYAGWGFAYPYFPGFYFVTGGSGLFDMDVGASLSLTPPVLNALSALLVFMIAVRILRDERVGLIAAGVVAVAMPFVYPNSHPIPASLGMLFVLASFSLLVGSSPNTRKKFVVLTPLAAAIVVTHHLSTYFLILALLMTVVLKSLLVRGTGLREIGLEAGILAATTAFALPYWLFYATPFKERILGDLGLVPWWGPILALVVFLALWPFVMALRNRSGWHPVPTYPTLRRNLALLAVALAFVFSLTISFTFVNIFGTSIRISPATVLYLAPLLILLAFAVAGRRILDFARFGYAPTSWFIAFVLSIVAGSVMGSGVLIPYRHIDYLLVPLAVMIGTGIVFLHDLAFTGRRGGNMAALLVFLLISGNAPLAYPPPGIMAGYDEGVSAQSLMAAQWLPSHVTGLIAGDHKSSMIAFGFGSTNATWDTARDSLLAQDFNGAMVEMLNVSSPSGRKRVDNVLLTVDSRSGAQFLPWEPAYALSIEAQAKFETSPYQRYYDDGYTQVYYVNWGLT